MATPNEPRPFLLHSDSLQQKGRGESLPCIGIIYALELEISPFKKILRDKKTVQKEGLRITSGNIGKANFILAKCGIGKAPAYQASKRLLQNFDVDCIISAGFAGALDEALTVGGIVTSNVTTSDHVVKTSCERHELKKKTGACAVDMESSGVKQAAEEHGLPFMLVKVISDTGDDLLLRQVILNPFRLFGGYLKAGKALARALSQNWD